MKYYKGFDQNLKCRDFQYEIGQTYEVEKAELCASGFHACENPLDVFKYYNPGHSRFCEVELDGIVSGERDDSKVCGKKITIIREISIVEFTQLCTEYMKEHNTSSEHNTGDRSSSSNTGDRSSSSNTGDSSSSSNTGNSSSSSNTGDRSSSSNTGYSSVAVTVGSESSAEVSGEQSLAVAYGTNSKAKGSLGSWITLTEWEN